MTPSKNPSRGLAAASPVSPPAGKGRRAYTYLGYDAMVESMKELEATFPDLVQLESAQQKYGLPSPGACGKRPCEMWLLRVTHEPSLAKAAVTAPGNSNGGGGGAPLDSRPEVFLSGALHGDERVGPTTTVEVARLLATAADCVEKSLLATDVESGSLCRGALTEEAEAMLVAGVVATTLSPPSATAATQENALRVRRRRLLWLHRLVRTRAVYVMPAANALGYYQNKRAEGSVDPNRDFPFVQAKNKCMQSVAARALNEVFREHMFQMAVTFHGGMQAIAYEWGSPIHPKSGHQDVSPDDTSQRQISKSLSKFSGGGGYSGGRDYPFRPMNSLVYPVNGGMEDWAYAASWETTEQNKVGAPSTVPKCVVDGRSNPTQTKGVQNVYPPERTVYTPSMLRVFNLLVETSDRKTPPENTLGSPRSLFLPHDDGGGSESDGHKNGHVSRNLRLALEAIDVVEPYVEWDFDAMRKGQGEGVESSWWEPATMANTLFTTDKKNSTTDKKNFTATATTATTAAEAAAKRKSSARAAMGSWLWGGTVRPLSAAPQRMGGEKSKEKNGKREEGKEGVGEGWSVSVAWRVGGAVGVDRTEILIGCWDGGGEVKREGQEGGGSGRGGGSQDERHLRHHYPRLLNNFHHKDSHHHHHHQASSAESLSPPGSSLMLHESGGGGGATVAEAATAAGVGGSSSGSGSSSWSSSGSVGGGGRQSWWEMVVSASEASETAPLSSSSSSSTATAHLKEGGSRVISVAAAGVGGSSIAVATVLAATPSSGAGRWLFPGHTFADPLDSSSTSSPPPPPPSSPSSSVPQAIHRSSLVLEAMDGDVFRAQVTQAQFAQLNCPAPPGSGGGGGGGGDAFVMARAVVDESWGDAPAGAKPAGSRPQTHLANARVNPEWSHQVGNHIVQGHKWWHSPPLRVVLNADPNLPRGKVDRQLEGGGEEGRRQKGQKRRATLNSLREEPFREEPPKESPRSEEGGDDEGAASANSIPPLGLDKDKSWGAAGSFGETAFLSKNAGAATATTTSVPSSPTPLPSGPAASSSSSSSAPLLDTPGGGVRHQWWWRWLRPMALFRVFAGFILLRAVMVMGQCCFGLLVRGAVKRKRVEAAEALL